VAEAHALSIAIHKLARGFTRAGYGHLRAQLTKAADSIASTIVEGCGAETNKEFARFLDMSIKSAKETEAHLLTSRDLDLIRSDIWEKFTNETVEIRKMTYGYRKKVLESPCNQQNPRKPKNSRKPRTPR